MQWLTEQKKKNFFKEKNKIWGGKNIYEHDIKFRHHKDIKKILTHRAFNFYEPISKQKVTNKLKGKDNTWQILSLIRQTKDLFIY